MSVPICTTCGAPDCANLRHRPVDNTPCQIGRVEFADPYQRTYDNPFCPTASVPVNPHLSDLSAIAQRERLIRDMGLTEDELSILILLASVDHLEGQAGECHYADHERPLRLVRLGLLVECGRTGDYLLTRYRVTARGKALVC